MLKIILISSFYLTSNFSHASVWNTDPNKQWTNTDEVNYSNFIKNTVGPDYFKTLGKPFSDIHLDCADAAYALRIYYSKINGLPFSAYEKTANNLTHNYDSILDENVRLAEFIKYVVDVSGTENLSGNDTYPIAIKDIRPGDVFLYKIKSSPEVPAIPPTDGNPGTPAQPAKYSRHTYIIKSINPNGTFNVMYSTQARRDANLPMNLITQYSFPNPRWVPNQTSQEDKNKWGFKRLKTPQQTYLDYKNIPDANMEQYALAIKLGDNFFNYVKEQLKTINETINDTFSRMLESLCNELKDRSEIVNMALEVRAKTNNACMDPATFDTYSTPSRDGGILGLYGDLSAKVTESKTANTWVNVNPTNQEILSAIFNSNRDQTAISVLKKSCSFTNLNTDIGRFYDALKSGKVSSHPNDSMMNRWGIITSSTAPLTTCPRY